MCNLQRLCGLGKAALFSCLLATQALASQGADWLRGQADDNGAIHALPAVAGKIASTAESIQALYLEDASGAPETAAALAYMRAQAVAETEPLAYQLRVQTLAGSVDAQYTRKLEALQRADGGFPSSAGYLSNPLDTAYALRALTVAEPTSAALPAAVAYLVDHQRPDGGYALPADTRSSIHVSAQVAQALTPLSAQFDLQTTLSTLSDFLLNQRNLSQPAAADYQMWPSHWETAQALLALLPLLDDLGPVQAAIDGLAQAQGAEGSWGQDVYTTALALQVEAWIKGVTLPPAGNRSRIQGVVVDQLTWQVVPSAVVRVDTRPVMEVRADAGGRFQLDGLPQGDFRLTIGAPGYQSRVLAVALTVGQQVDLGQIPLFRATDKALLRGYVSAEDTGQALPGVEIRLSGADNQRVSTDANGHYAVEIDPGDSAIAIQHPGYEAIQAQINATAGVVYDFSPVLQPTGSPPPVDTRVSGTVLSASNQAPLAGVTVSLEGGSAVQTDAQGRFAFSGLAPGAMTFTFEAQGYHGAQATTTLPAGSFDLGQILLTPRSVATSVELSGTITDAATGLPLQGVRVQESATGNQVLTNAQGEYQLNGIPELELDLTLSKSGYFTQTTHLSFTGFGQARHDATLMPQTGGEIQIVDLRPSATILQSRQELELELTLANTGSQDIPVWLFITVTDFAGRVIQDGPVTLVPIGGNPESAWVRVPAQGQQVETIDWFTASHPPGDYTITITAWNTGKTRRLAEAGVQVTLEQTRAVGGLVQFDPPVMQFDPDRQVQLTATLTNAGNVPTGDFDLLAQVILSARAENPPDYALLTQVVATGFPDRVIHGMARQADGSVLMAAEQDVLLFDPQDQQVRVLASGFMRAMDVAIAADGRIFVLDDRSRNIVELNSGGDTVQTFATGVYPNNRLAVVGNGLVWFVSGQGLHELNPATGRIRQISRNILQNPQGVAVADNGDIYLAGDDAIYRYDGNTLSVFVRGLKDPRGIRFDTNGDLLVAEWTARRVIRIDANGGVHELATGIRTPFDVQPAGDGSYFVPETNYSQILKIHPDGSRETVVRETFSNPSRITYDSQGNHYLLWGRHITRFATDGSITELPLPAGLTPQNMLLDEADQLWFTSGCDVYRQNGSGGFDQVFDAPFFGICTLALTDTAGQVMLSDGSRMWRLDGSTGIAQPENLRLSTDTLPVLQFGANGKLLALYAGTQGYLSEIDPATQSVQPGQQYFDRPWAFYEAANGDRYVAEQYKRKVYRLDNQGNVQLYRTLDHTPYHLMVMANGDVLYSSGSALYRSTGNGGDSLFAQLPFSVSNTLARMRLNTDGSLWFSSGSSQGLARVDLASGSVEQIRLSSNGSQIRAYYGLAADGAGGLYLGGLGEVWHYDGSTTTAVALPAEVPNKAVVNLAYRQNSLWLQMDLNGSNLFVVDDQGTLLQHTSLSGRILDHQQVDGHWYLATRNSAGGALLRYPRGLGYLPEVVLQERVQTIRRANATELLLRTSSGLSRFDLASQAQTGILQAGDIRDHAIHAGEVRVIHSRNRLALYDLNGGQLDSYVSIIYPKGLAMDAAGELYVNSAHGLVRLRPDGYGDLLANETGNYLAARGRELYTVRTNVIYRVDSQTGDLTRITPSPPTSSLSGVAPDPAGGLFLSTREGLAHMAGDGTLNILSPALHGVQDLHAAPDGYVSVAVSRSGRSDVVRLSANGLVEGSYLAGENLPNGLQTISWDDHDGLYLSFDNASHGLYYRDNTGGLTRFPDPFADSSTARDILALTGDRLLASEGRRNRDRLLLLQRTDRANAGPAEGDVIYQRQLAVNNLPVDSAPLQLDLGTLQLPVAGSYTVEVTGLTAEPSLSLANTLSTTALAEGQLTLAQTEVFPGDNQTRLDLNLRAVEARSVVEIRPDQVLEITSASTYYKFFVATPDGNIVGIASRHLYRHDLTTGQVQSWLPAEGAIDVRVNAAGEVHVLLTNRIVRIDGDGQIVQAWPIPPDLGVIYFDFAPDGSLFAYARYARNTGALGVYKWVNSVQQWEQVLQWSWTAISGFEIGESGAFYFIGSDEVVRVQLDEGDYRQARILNDFSLEGEAYNVELMCYENLLLGPVKMPAVGLNSSEEHTVVHYDPNNGLPQLIFDSETLGMGIIDNDAMHYDRFNHRILLSTDGQHGIFSIPAYCGSLTVELHLRTRPDVEIEVDSGAAPPKESIEHADGSRELAWQFKDVGEQNFNFPLQARFLGLREGETRPVLAEAYLLFNNSLLPGQQLRVDLDIPSIHASSAKELQVSLNDSLYPAHTDVEIRNTVVNASGQVFSGEIVQQIETGQGLFVAPLTPLSVDGLVAGGRQSLQSLWNTGNYFAGGYQVVSRLLDENGVEQATATSPFTIQAGSGAGALAALALNTDKPEYGSVDQVLLTAEVTNLAGNALLQDTRARLLVTQPDGAVIFQRTTPVDTLAPETAQAWAHTLSLDQSPVGRYTTTLDLLNTQGTIVASTRGGFDVRVNSQQFLAGRVSVQHPQVYRSESNRCTYRLENTGSTTIRNLLVRQLVLESRNGQIVHEQQQRINLAAGQSWVREQPLDTTDYNPVTHLCILRTETEGRARTQAEARFTVLPAHAITGRVWQDRNANGREDPDEPGLAGVAVGLQRALSRAVVEYTRTDADGRYRFPPQSEGDYIVNLNQNGDLAAYQLTTGNHPAEIRLAGGGQTVSFGYQPLLGRVEGQVFTDHNENGRMDTGELPLAGVYLQLYRQNSAGDYEPYATQTSDNQGRYAFPEVLVGQYYLHAKPPTGMRITVPGSDSAIDPVSGNSAPFVLSTGQQQIVGVGFLPVQVTVLNPPAGLKWSRPLDEHGVRWRMAWYNPANDQPLRVRIADPLAEGSQLRAGSLLCESVGNSRVDTCRLSADGREIIVHAQLAPATRPDDAGVRIRLDVTLDDDLYQITNQATAHWDANDNGQTRDEMDAGQTPVRTLDGYSREQRPTVGVPLRPVPAYNPWLLGLLALLLTGATARYRMNRSRNHRI